MNREELAEENSILRSKLRACERRSEALQERIVRDRARFRRTLKAFRERFLKDLRGLRRGLR